MSGCRAEVGRGGCAGQVRGDRQGDCGEEDDGHSQARAPAHHQQEEEVGARRMRFGRAGMEALPLWIGKDVGGVPSWLIFLFSPLCGLLLTYQDRPFMEKTEPRA